MKLSTVGFQNGKSFVRWRRSFNQQWFWTEEGRFVLIEMMTVVRLWNKLQSKSVSASSLEVFKVGLGGILGSQIQWEESLSKGGGLEPGDLWSSLQLKPIGDSF